MPPEIVIIGHMCYDKTPQGYILGGAAAYSGVCAQRLGKRAGIITSVKEDFLFLDQFTDSVLQIVPAKHNTIFENSYEDGYRIQHLLGRASEISERHIPPGWKKSPLVFIGPIAKEVDPDILKAFESSQICVNLQGWMRHWNESGKVTSIFPEDCSFLEPAAFVCLSLEDVDNDPLKVEALTRYTRTLMVTEGAEGLTVYQNGLKHHFPAFPATEVDPTGAGDIFAMAFIVRFSETGSLKKAVAFAQAAASISIEKTGTSGIPGRKAIEEKLKRYLRG